MSTPLSNRPRITENDIANGYVMRYFVKFIDHNRIVEVDKTQYVKLSRNALYQSLELVWLIGGTDTDSVATDGTVIRGTEYRNQVTIDFYDKKMRGLKGVLSNPLEYFNGIRT